LPFDPPCSISRPPLLARKWGQEGADNIDGAAHIHNELPIDGTFPGKRTRFLIEREGLVSQCRRWVLA